MTMKVTRVLTGREEVEVGVPEMVSALTKTGIIDPVTKLKTWWCRTVCYKLVLCDISK